MIENVEGITRVCPSCGSSFVCRNDDIALCQCVNVRLSAEDRAYIAERYDTCLCAACLKSVARQRRSAVDNLEAIIHAD